MIPIKIPSGVLSVFGKVSSKIGPHAPKLLMVGGTTCLVGACVATAVTTNKAAKELESVAEEIDNIKDNYDLKDNITEKDEKEFRRKIKRAYRRGVRTMAKLYLPVAVLIGLGIFCICKSNKILTDMNKELAAGLAAESTAFTKYRREVANRFGKEVDNDIFYGRSSVEETEMLPDGTSRTKTAKLPDSPADYDNWTFFFDEATARHIASATNGLLNHSRLIQIQSQANDILSREGVITVNQVLDLCDLSQFKTSKGHVFGWRKYNPSNVALIRYLAEQGIDNFVDFGLDNTEPILSEPVKVIKLNNPQYIADAYDEIKNGMLHADWAVCA